MKNEDNSNWQNCLDDPGPTDSDYRNYPPCNEYFADHQLQGKDRDLELITLGQLARDCYHNGIPNDRFLAEVTRWRSCPVCREPVTTVMVNQRRFVVKVIWVENREGYIRPFADLQGTHGCAGVD